MFEQLKTAVLPVLSFLAPLLVAWAIGALGTLLEALGSARGWTWLVAVGQRLEAIGADLPKLKNGSRLTALDAKLAPPSEHRARVNPPPLVVLALAAFFALLAVGCGASGLPSSAAPGESPMAERRARAEAAAHAVEHGIGIVKDACTTYIAYRSLLPKPAPEVDVTCERLLAPAEPAPPEPAPPAEAPVAPPPATKDPATV